MTQGKRWFREWRFWLAAFFFTAVAVLWLGWPIIALDFDLWYHLTGGAFIAAHLALPTGPFFSFFDVTRGWVDYYWLYQLLVHGLQQMAGYGALVALRAGVYLATILGLYRFFRAGLPGASGGFVVSLLGTGAYALALMPRELLLRPHAFTYLYIVLLHLVLNSSRRLVWLLPLATVVWANLHGVEYPVIMLVCGAYLAEYFADKLLGRPQAERLRAARWPLILSLYAVLVTPAGLKLLATPFAMPPFHELGVIELARQPLDSFLELSFYPDGRLVQGVTHGLVLAAVIGAIGLAVARRLRLGRLLLLVGGLVLLPMMRRFTFEFVLLALPVVADAAGLVLEKLRGLARAWPRWLVPAGAVAVVAVTLCTVSTYLGNRPAYPVELARLPSGVCDFLLREGPGGRIFNVPNPGGYLQWRLFPKYRIGMDMETMLFPTPDFYASINAFSDPTLLGKVLERYHPAFLLAEANNADAKKTIAAFPQFAPVFFDDVLVLYADATVHPELVQRFRLEVLDSVAWSKDNYETMPAERRDKALAECRRLLSIYPGGLVANTIAAKILLARGETAMAAVHADVLIRRFPDRYMGYALRGLAAFKSERYEEALDDYAQALPRTLPAEREAVWRNIYAADVRLKRFDKAYAALLRICDPLGRTTSAKDLYDLSLAAVASGRQREGRTLLDLARLKVPAQDAKLAKDIETFAGMLPAAP